MGTSSFGPEARGKTRPLNPQPLRPHWRPCTGSSSTPGSGLYLRELPIRGIDTKWIEANGCRVIDLLRQVHGGLGDLYALGGPRRVPDLLRLRILDPTLRRPLGGLSDLSAPL